jgi:dystonin
MNCMLTLFKFLNLTFFLAISELLERTQSLEDTARKLADFNDNLRELAHSLGRCEDKLKTHDALGGASKDPKLLERIKNLREETAALKLPLQTVKQQASDLVTQASENGADASSLQDDVDALADRLEDLTSRLDDRCSDLQSAATAVTQFNDQVKGLTHNLSGLEEELDAMKPPAREVKVVRTQIDETSKLIRKISKAGEDVAQAVEAGEELVDSGFAADVSATREQVEILQRQFGRLDERAKGREEALESALQRLESFYEVHTAIVREISEVWEETKRFKAVGTEVEAIRNQQEEFRHFHASNIEGLTGQVDDCNKSGQGLIQSASPGVNTTTLEKDLEKMNEKWNELKEKLNERQRKLDVALLQTGKFQEALDGLAKWLADTEEMVANQKPPSADYKVVKAQLQEQKVCK